MREIKFRAWNTLAKAMLHFENLKGIMDDKDRYGIFIPVVENRMYMGGSYEMMQYIGLKDKNGKEIYEGDILNLWRSIGSNGEKRGEYYKPLAVTYCNQWCQFVVADESIKTQYSIWREFSEFVVIGNIYENPELLKESD